MTRGPVHDEDVVVAAQVRAFDRLRLPVVVLDAEALSVGLTRESLGVPAERDVGLRVVRLSRGGAATNPRPSAATPVTAIRPHDVPWKARLRWERPPTPFGKRPSAGFYRGSGPVDGFGRPALRAA